MKENRNIGDLYNLFLENPRYKNIQKICRTKTVSSI